MRQIINKVERELKDFGLTLDEVENEHIIEACTAKVALVDNFTADGIDFYELEREVFPDSSFINQMIIHLDKGGSGEDMISAFLIKASFCSPELREYLGLSIEE